MLTPAERDAGWRLLFDGRTTAGWRGYRSDGMPSGWQVIDGALTRVAPAGDIVTTNQYGNFELTLEWRVAEGRQQRNLLPRERGRELQRIWITAQDVLR